jgi:hypothetical protein
MVTNCNGVAQAPAPALAQGLRNALTLARRYARQPSVGVLVDPA